MIRVLTLDFRCNWRAAVAVGAVPESREREIGHELRAEDEEEDGKGRRNSPKDQEVEASLATPPAA